MKNLNDIQDQGYKYGFIHYNPNNPKFIVRKSNGLGYTINFAHKTGVLALFFLLVLLFLIVTYM